MPATDAELLQRMQQGDRDAFKQLYERYHQQVFRFALMDSGKDGTAADITHEVFMQLMENVSFDPAQGSLGGYLYGITRNLLRRQARDGRRHEPLMSDDDGALNEALIEHREPFSLVSHAQQQHKLRAAIIDLPANFREIIVLCELEEVDYQDAARILQIPIGTVRSRLNRARKALAQALTAMEAARSTMIEEGQPYELRAV
jgi:RNA polymerase sigma-70 factor, ECF subfamily